MHILSRSKDRPLGKIDLSLAQSPKNPQNIKKNQKKDCKLKKIYPINMKIPGAHFQMASNQCKVHAFISQNMRGQNRVHRRRTDIQTDRRTEDRVKPLHPPPPNSFAGGIITSECWQPRYEATWSHISLFVQIRLNNSHNFHIFVKFIISAI